MKNQVPQIAYKVQTIHGEQSNANLGKNNAIISIYSLEPGYVNAIENRQ
jgi:hypothetical protein